MSKKYEETKTIKSGTNANRVGVLEVKKETTRKFRVPESKKVELEKIETKYEPHVEPFVRTYVTVKKSMTKMKSLKRKCVQSSDSNLGVDED